MSRPPGGSGQIHHHSAPDTKREEGADPRGLESTAREQQPKFRLTGTQQKPTRGQTGQVEGPGLEGEDSSPSAEGFGAAQG